MAVRKARSSRRSKAARARGGASRRKTASRPTRRAAPRSARKAASRPRARKPVSSSPVVRGPHARRPLGLLVQHMDYTSHALDEVKRFYTELLGFDRFDHDERFQYLAITTGESSALGFMPPMPGPPEQWRPPREPAIYLRVEDVDRAHRELRSRGVAFEQDPTDMPWGDRVARLRDPEGRMLCLASTPRKAARKGRAS